MTNVQGVLYSGRTTVPLLGTNPSQDVLLAYFSREFPNSYPTLWRIAQAESNLQQFRDDGHPKWSGDGHQGVGIMQITYPAPSEDEIWDWKKNADAGSRVLQNAYGVARSWPSTVSGSGGFTRAVDAVNAAREKAELPKLSRVTVPDFSSGNLLCNLQERELDAIRLYNGAGGTDHLGLPLHEYQLASSGEENLLGPDGQRRNPDRRRQMGPRHARGTTRKPGSRGLRRQGSGQIRAGWLSLTCRGSTVMARNRHRG